MMLEMLLLTLVFVISTINGGSSNFNGAYDSKQYFLRENSTQHLKFKRGTSIVPTAAQDLAAYERAREIRSEDLLLVHEKQTTTRRDQEAKDKTQLPHQEKSPKGKHRDEQDREEGGKHQQAEREKYQQTGKEGQHQVEREREREKHEQKIRKKNEKIERKSKAKESRNRIYNSTVNALSSIFVDSGIASDIVKIVRPTITRAIGNKISEKVNNALGSAQQQQKQNEAVGRTLGEQKDTTAEMMVATEQTIAPVAVGYNGESTGMEVESGSATVADTASSEQAEIVGEQTEINGESNEEAGGQAGEKVLKSEAEPTIEPPNNSDPITRGPNAGSEGDATIETANNNEPTTEGPSADDENVVKLETKENQSDAEKQVEPETNEESIPKLEQDSTQVGTDVQN